MELTPKLEFLGLTFDLTVMIGTIVAAVLAFLIVVLGTRGRSMIPSGMQNVVEMIIEFIRGVTNMMLEPRKAEKYLSFAISIFLFILIANLLGVFIMISSEVHHPIPALGITAGDLQNLHEINWFKSPTSNINVTVALAVAITLYAHFAGLFKGPKQYFSHYVQPYKWMLPLHIIDELAKPTTHAARLWANIFAGEVLILILRDSLSYFYLTAWPLFAWIGFSIFVGVIQAYIFTVLAMVYISQKVSDEH